MKFSGFPDCLLAQEGEFRWNENMQGVVLASFFYGYVTTQILGGILAQKFGGKRLLLFGIFWTAVLTILTPIFTRVGGFPAIVATRVLEGIGEVRRSASELAVYISCDILQFNTFNPIFVIVR